MEKHSIYVTTGTNQYNFDRMLEQVKECLAALGTENYAAHVQFGSSSKITIPSTTELAEFFSREKSERLYKESSLVFSHCGIGSIFNSLKYNTPTIIFTRLKKYDEFSDDHQLQISAELKTNPLIFIVDEYNDNLVADFLAFVARVQTVKKQEVDLINYDLANQIKSALFEE